MVATAAGIDSRLLEAAQALLMAGRGSPTGQPMSLPDFLRRRCEQLLAGFPTSLEEDEQVLRELQNSRAAPSALLPEGGRHQQLATAVAYRLGKKRVLESTLKGLLM
jgi:hypothetical protein